MSSLSATDANFGGTAGMAGATQRLAIDAQSLDALKLQAKTDPDQALRQAARQFESVFMNMLMKSMRDASPKEGLLDSESGGMYRDMLDQQWVDTLSKKGMGIADAMLKQLQRNQGLGQGENRVPDAAAITVSSTVVPAVVPTASVATLSTLERINKNTLQGAAQINDAASPARNFVQRLWNDAKQAGATTGVPAQFILGQAALESGWGQREIRHADGSPSHNLFGIKAGSDWKGAVTETMTTEYVNGHPTQRVEKFRAYASYAEGFADYAHLLTAHPRYAQALSAGQDAAQFAMGLQKAGYATDPHYAQKLTQVIQKTLSLLA